MAVLPGNRNYRGDGLWVLNFKTENHFGRENNLVRTQGQLLGLVESWTFPDPEYEYYTFRYARPTSFMPPDSSGGLATTASGAAPGAVTTGALSDTYAGSVGTPSVRNWVAIYDGPKRFAGTVPDIRLLSGHILPFIFGAASNEAANVQATENLYRHYIVERSELPSFTLEGVLFNTSGNVSHYLVRRARGCKVSRATISAEEGGVVRVSLDEILAKGARHNSSSVSGEAGTNNTPYRDYLGYHTNLAWGSTEQPIDILMGNTSGRSLENMDIYKFSEGRIEIYRPNASNLPDTPAGADAQNGNTLETTTLARIRSFRLTVNNNITANYWINNLNRQATNGPDNNGTSIVELRDDDLSAVLIGQQHPTALVEGSREYELEMVIAVPDQYIYERLVSEGKFGREKRGFGIRLRLERQVLGNNSNAFSNSDNTKDFMEFRMPADTSGVANRQWSASFNYATQQSVSGPIAGMGSTNTAVGCFFASTPYAVAASTTEPLLYVTCRILVPSCDVRIQDRNRDYLSPGII